MSEVIFSADLIKYNANNRGTHTGDCVNRAISFAFDKPYAKVNQDLNAALKNTGWESWKFSHIYDRVIKLYGGSSRQKLDDQVSLGEFADANPEGCFIVTTGKKKGDLHTDHLVCVRDGKIFDSWDSRSQIAKYIYIVEGAPSVEITDLKDRMRDLEAECRDALYKEADTVMSKNWPDIPISDIMFKVSAYSDIDGYTISFPCSAYFYNFCDKDHTYRFEIAFVFSPTMTWEDAMSVMKKTVKVRMYDRLYAIKQKLNSIKEEYEEVGRDWSNKAVPRFRFTDHEKRTIATLPAWVRARITFFDIDNPGQYHDSYTLRMKPLPDDPREYSSGEVTFKAYNVSELRDALDIYKQTYEVPYLDYGP